MFPIHGMPHAEIFRDELSEYNAKLFKGERQRTVRDPNSVHI